MQNSFCWRRPLNHHGEVFVIAQRCSLAVGMNTKYCVLPGRWMNSSATTSRRPWWRGTKNPPTRTIAVRKITLWYV